MATLQNNNIIMREMQIILSHERLQSLSSLLNYVMIHAIRKNMFRWKFGNSDSGIFLNEDISEADKFTIPAAY